MSKGAIEYFSSFVTTMTSMFSVLFILVIGVIVLFFIYVKVNVDVIGNIVYEVPKSANVLISFMDTTYEEHSIGDLFAYSVWNGNTKFQIGDDEIDLQELSLKDFFKDEAGYKLVFELNDKEYEIDSFGNIDSGVYTEAPILAGDKQGKLKLWSRLYL